MTIRCFAMLAWYISAVAALSLVRAKNDGKQIPIWLLTVILIFMAAMGEIAIPDSSLSWNF